MVRWLQFRAVVPRRGTTARNSDRWARADGLPTQSLTPGIESVHSITKQFPLRANTSLDWRNPACNHQGGSAPSVPLLYRHHCDTARATVGGTRLGAVTLNLDTNSTATTFVATGQPGPCLIACHLSWP
uniref:Uncharacterized protein MLCL622.03 n=1 Tax=Mycobacterium leprae TaxID=1769 RepID=O06066_MYCLR|nr:unknown [Mycobacterium leprae]